MAFTQTPYQKALDKAKIESVVPGDGQPWGGINHYDALSRWTIADQEFDDLVNWLPMGNSLRQVPALSAVIATLVSPILWMTAQTLNGGEYIFALCQNGHCYQVAIPGGVITDVSGATTLGASTDIANWQGTTILLSDPSTSTLYSWNGTTFATAIASPNWHANYITVFGGRLWGAFTNTIQFTDTNTYNSLGGSAGAFVITEFECTKGILGLISFNGQLYIWGPNYNQVLGNLNVVGSPPVLQFTKYTLQSQIGINNKWSVVAVGQSLFFTNSYGVWSLSGAVPNKVSSVKGAGVDGIIAQAGTGSTFSGGFCQIYGEPVIMWNLLYSGNPNVSTANTQIGLTSDQLWFRTVFGAITFITSDNYAGNPTMWASDGTHIWQMFASTAGNVTSYFQTKIFNMGSTIAYKVLQKFAFTCVITSPTAATMQAVDINGNLLFSGNGNLSTVLNWVNNFNQVITWLNNASAVVTWISGTTLWQAWQFDVATQARGFGLQFSLVGAGAAFQSIPIEYELSSAAWGP